jgi:hypothetical protein
MASADPFTVAGWTFGNPPAGWEAIPGAGLRHNQTGCFPSNVVVVADDLPERVTLEAYIERQVTAMRAHLREPRFVRPAPATLAGAEEVIELGVEHTAEGGTAVVQRQLYARRGRRISVVTLTTIATDADGMRPVFDAILRRMKGAG